MSRFIMHKGHYRHKAFVSLIAIALFILAGCVGNGPRAVDESYLHVRAEEARARGIEAFSKGDFSSALHNFGSALKIDRAVDDRDAEVVDLINIARVSIYIGDMPGAESYLDTAIKVSLDANNVKSLGEAYATLAKVEYLTGRHSLALTHVEESIEVDKKHGIQSGAALNLMGVILAEAGKVKEAHHVLLRALQLNTDNSNSLERANSFRSLGHLNDLMKKHDRAMEQYKMAYELDTEAGNSEKIAVDLSSMAAIHRKLGHLTKAAYLLERSYIVNLNGGRPLKAIDDLTLLIETYSRLEMPDKVHYFARIKDSLVTAYENGME